MSQQPTEDLIRASYKSLNLKKGGSHFDEWWHEDGEFINAREDPDHATHRGLGEIRTQAQAWFDAFPDLRLEPVEVRANGDRAFVWTHIYGHGADSGIAIDMDIAQVFTLEGGRIRRIEEYLDRRGPRSRGAAGVGDVAGELDLLDAVAQLGARRRQSLDRTTGLPLARPGRAPGCPGARGSRRAPRSPHGKEKPLNQ